MINLDFLFYIAITFMQKYDIVKKYIPDISTFTIKYEKGYYDCKIIIDRNKHDSIIIYANNRKNTFWYDSPIDPLLEKIVKSVFPNDDYCLMPNGFAIYGNGHNNNCDFFEKRNYRYNVSANNISSYIKLSKNIHHRNKYNINVKLLSKICYLFKIYNNEKHVTVKKNMPIYSNQEIIHNIEMEIKNIFENNKEITRQDLLKLNEIYDLTLFQFD
ncbi:hypothetical protein [Alphaentomopoxvirus acuprea]|uniref:Uncharacterized protein n=1 Tax=Alphaentomopoxvirus acuprea TaxID=62099 RepID=W6JJ03_9POXV|nr:hypothetical protein BA82_gp238 [Anomala cuprea entomopoxvirus]BAO49598.1 hypothetical protein [Anomala cuprea entomopoxvirus]